MSNKEAIGIPTQYDGGFTFLDVLPDPHTDRRLLPSCLVQEDNSRRMKHYKAALRIAMSACLTPTQREQLQLHYDEGLCKSAIARRQQQTCSAVSKSIKASKTALRDYIKLYMDIYDKLEREFLSGEE